ncbi:MAG: hypothetical protein H6742_11890 [Alphaproteobacteria bacterium]|nr:hypothetical protein [Alphaproteobacteria bacterium]
MRGFMWAIALLAGCGDKGEDSGDEGAATGAGTLTLSDLDDSTGVLVEETALTAVLYNHQTDPFQIWLLSRSEGTLQHVGDAVLDTMTLSNGTGGCEGIDELAARSDALVAGLSEDGPIPVADICGPLSTWFDGERASVDSGERMTLMLTAEELWFDAPRTTSVEAEGGVVWRDGPDAWYRGWDADACAFTDLDEPTVHRFGVRDGVLSLDADANTGDFHGQLDEPGMAAATVDATFTFATCTYGGAAVVLVSD